MTDAATDRGFRLVHVLNLPTGTSVKPPPAPVDLSVLVAFSETRLAQLNGRPGAEEERLVAKSRRKFAIRP